jgi:Serine dehydrogenase proteinase
MPDHLAKAKQEFESALLVLQKKRKSKVFAIVHSFESDHLCTPHFQAILRDRDQFKGIDTLEVLVHSPGGHANIAYRMARFFRAHCQHLNFIVPMSAKSAATLMCSAGQHILMGELAELGPLDVQLTDEFERGKRPFSPLDEFKSMEFLREYATEFLDYFTFVLAERGLSVKQALHESIPAVASMTQPLFAHIGPSKVGSYRRNLAEGEEYARRLLEQTGNPYTEQLVQKLVWKYPVHDFVIDYAEAKEMGLPVALLDPAEEKIISPAIQGMVKYGLSYSGFVHAPIKMPKAKSARKKLPTGIKAAAPIAS